MWAVTSRSLYYNTISNLKVSTYNVIAYMKDATLAANQYLASWAMLFEVLG